MPSRAPGLAVRGLCSQPAHGVLEAHISRAVQDLSACRVDGGGTCTPSTAGSVNQLMTTHLGEDLSSTASLLPHEAFILSLWPVECEEQGTELE